METATGKFGPGLRKERVGRTGNIKKVHNHEYHVPEESREEMDVEKPKRCNEDHINIDSLKQEKIPSRRQLQSCTLNVYQKDEHTER